MVHLAGLSNDPLGNLDPELTREINTDAARAPRPAPPSAAGVPRFVFSSSCSNYGAAGNDFIDESADFRPVTPYGRSKAAAEPELAPLADERFSPVLMRSSTAFGVSPRLRFDLVVNNLTAYAVTTGDSPEERRHALAAARPYRGHRARLPRGGRGAARAGSHGGLQRRRDRRELPRHRDRAHGGGGGARRRDPLRARTPAPTRAATASTATSSPGPCRRAGAMDGARRASSNSTTPSPRHGVNAEEFEGPRFARAPHVRAPDCGAAA